MKRKFSSDSEQSADSPILKKIHTDQPAETSETETAPEGSPEPKKDLDAIMRDASLSDKSDNPTWAIVEKNLHNHKLYCPLFSPYAIAFSKNQSGEVIKNNSSLFKFDFLSYEFTAKINMDLNSVKYVPSHGFMAEDDKFMVMFYKIHFREYASVAAEIKRFTTDAIPYNSFRLTANSFTVKKFNFAHVAPDHSIKQITGQLAVDIKARKWSGPKGIFMETFEMKPDLFNCPSDSEYNMLVVHKDTLDVWLAGRVICGGNRDDHIFINQAPKPRMFVTPMMFNTGNGLSFLN